MNKRVLSKEQIEAMIDVFLDTAQLAEQTMQDVNVSQEEYVLASRVKEKAEEALKILATLPNSQSKWMAIEPITRTILDLIGRIIFILFTNQ